MATRKPKTIDFWRGDLPHWQVENGRYFVTIHLHGAVPEVAHQRIRELSAEFRRSDVDCKDNVDHQYLELSRRIFLEMERWLDRSPAVAHFRHAPLAEMIVESIEHRQHRRIWEMLSFVVMPSHLHLFFELNNDLSLKRELEKFKRWTGHQASKMDTQFSNTRFWQTEWFDHWSRSEEGDEKIMRYIQNNPIKAGLAEQIGEYSYCRP